MADLTFVILVLRWLRHIIHKLCWFENRNPGSKEKKNNKRETHTQHKNTFIHRESE